jgi:hypothetical protein
MERICKNCVHWKQFERWDNKPHTIGKCDNKFFEYSGDDYPLETTGKLLYYDGSGYMAGFEVDAKFGCIHFEIKHENEQVEEL